MRALPHPVAVLALDGVKPFDLGIPAQVLGQALGPTGKPLYEVATCSLQGRPVTTNLDFTIAVTHDETALASADTVVVATQDFTSELPSPGGLNRELDAALASIRPSTRVVS